jgi:hypothetical protein
MKISWLVIAICIWMTQSALADAYDFYYEKCLEGAALIMKSPNADGSIPNPDDPTFDILNPSKPLLYSSCRQTAIMAVESRK